MEPDRHRFLRWMALPVSLVLIGEVVAVLKGFDDKSLVKIDSLAQDLGNTKTIGEGLFSNYLLPFEVTSVLILMALVGAVVLARRDPK